SESHASAILGDSEVTVTGGAVTASPAPQNSGNIASPALVTSSYVNYQLTEQLYAGVSINAPFGLTTKPDQFYDGALLGSTSRLLTFNAAPTIGYKIAPGLSVAAGIQVQYITAKLSTENAALGTVRVEADDIGVGFTAGILYQPSSWTSIGLGFRSSISHTLEGDQTNALGRDDVEASADLPEIVTFSFKQNLTQQFAVLGTVEWTNWSRIQSVGIICQNGQAGVCAPGGELSSLDLHYDDGWFFSLGFEYAYTPATKIRAGFAYEISPARGDESRTVRLADNDRYWFSAGVGHKLTDTMEIDLSYTHIAVEDGGIETRNATGALLLAGDVESSVNIFSAALKMKLQ
ncbi:MAG: outer membrane protein transport protein, partial [Pseudomonadota bacterium]